MRKAVVCDLSALAGPRRVDRKASRMTAEELEHFGRIADAHGCRDALRCLDPQVKPVATDSLTAKGKRCLHIESL